MQARSPKKGFCACCMLFGGSKFHRNVSVSDVPANVHPHNQKYTGRRRDYVGFAVPVVSLMLPPVGHMHMAVDKKTGLIFVHQRIKNLKSLVRQIRPSFS